MTDWLTTTEAATLLGIRTNTVTCRCTRGLYHTQKVPSPTPGNGNTTIWLIKRADIEAELRKLAYEREQEERGLHHCRNCDGWFKPKEMHSRWQCYGCYKNVIHRCNKRRRSFGKVKRDPPPDMVDDWHVGKPPSPEDSLKYACMGVGFSHRPLPTIDGKRLSKREAFCSSCDAPRCVHHPHLTPAQVRKAKKVPREPAEDWE